MSSLSVRAEGVSPLVDFRKKFERHAEEIYGSVDRICEAFAASIPLVEAARKLLEDPSCRPATQRLSTHTKIQCSRLYLTVQKVIRSQEGVLGEILEALELLDGALKGFLRRVTNGSEVADCLSKIVQFSGVLGQQTPKYIRENRQNLDREFRGYLDLLRACHLKPNLLEQVDALARDVFSLLLQC